ncbi:hypothetical protein [Arthrobacter sp. zg-Y877]|uniref:hypothetical protein n=1 Tax=Arthrobacter sp. zg-Y877 TaxID=3049074 RepID=UPI0033901839
MIDDYQDAATRFADWEQLADQVELTVFSDHLADEDAVAARLAGFDVVVIMRERTPFPASLLARLPRLKLLVTTGARNASIDLAADHRHRSARCHARPAGVGEDRGAGCPGRGCIRDGGPSLEPKSHR